MIRQLYKTESFFFLHFVYLVVYHLSFLLDNNWICAHDPNMKPSVNFEVDKEGWNSYNLYFWLWQSTDIAPTVDRYSADNQRSTYRPSVGRYINWDIWYVDQHSADISVDKLIDMSTDIISVPAGVHKLHMTVIVTVMALDWGVYLISSNDLILFY